jgi:hypothetical protein
MTRLTRGLLAGVAMPALLTACFDGGGSTVTPPVVTPPPAPVALQNQFGAAFSALFSASVDVEATEPAAMAVPSPDLNKEGIDG